MFLYGPNKLTRFEKARIIGARALQISMGAPTLSEVSKGTSNLIDIALKELEENLLPMTIRRTFPDGSFEDVSVMHLLAQKN